MHRFEHKSDMAGNLADGLHFGELPAREPCGPPSFALACAMPVSRAALVASAWTWAVAAKKLISVTVRMLAVHARLRMRRTTHVTVLVNPMIWLKPDSDGTRRAGLAGSVGQLLARIGA
jgi:hypothetical protein